MDDEDSVLPYDPTEGPDDDWTAKAYEFLKNSRLHVKVTKPRTRKLKVRATGSCPRCGHDVAYEFFETITGPALGHRLNDQMVGPVLGLERMPDPYQDFTILCWCHNSHPGAPPKVRGCGAAFTASVWVGIVV